MLQFERHYKVKVNDNLGDPGFWNSRFQDIDGRVNAVESLNLRADAAIQEIISTGIDRINTSLDPLIVDAETQIADVLAALGAIGTTVDGNTYINLIKHYETTGQAPTSLLSGQLAINTVDHLLFYRNAGGTVSSFDITLADYSTTATIASAISAAVAAGTTDMATRAYVAGLLAGKMSGGNNLSEITNTATARNNLGLGSGATANISNYFPLAGGVTVTNQFSTNDFVVSRTTGGQPTTGYIYYGNAGSYFGYTGTYFITSSTLAVSGDLGANGHIAAGGYVSGTNGFFSGTVNGGAGSFSGTVTAGAFSTSGTGTFATGRVAGQLMVNGAEGFDGPQTNCAINVASGIYGGAVGTYAVIPGATCLYNRMDRTDQAFASFFFGGTNVGYINSDGANCFYVNASDVRIKSNIEDYQPDWRTFMRLQTRTYNVENVDIEQVGFVAQEAVKHRPNMVVRGDDDPRLRNGDPGFRLWGVDTSKLVPELVALVQDLQTRLIEAERKLAELT